MNGYRFLISDAREDVEKAQRLRYEVYSLEMGLLTTNQGGLERDEYDDYSTSLLALDENDRAVGTVRCVHNNPLGFPMDKDFPLTDYMKTHHISRGLEIGRFAINKDVRGDARLTVVSGLFNCLYGYCCERGIYDLFAVTHPKIIENYRMPGVKIIGKPFRYSKPLTGGLWVPLHINALEAYQSFSMGVQTPARVA